VERRHPDVGRACTNLKHPPFTFKLDHFEPGELRAVGYLHGHEAGSFTRRTPSNVIKLDLQVDVSGKKITTAGKDVMFCHASLQDNNDAIAPGANAPIFFGATGDVRLVGENPATAEAGIASVLVETSGAKNPGALFAIALVKEENQVRILSSALSPTGGHVPNYVIRYTTDGSEPTVQSPVYSRPITNPGRIKAAVFVGGSLIVARAD